MHTLKSHRIRQDLKIKVWDLITSKLTATLSGHYSPPTTLQLLDKWTLISSGTDKVLIVWDLRKYTRKRTIPIYEEINTLLAVPTKQIQLPKGVKRFEGEGKSDRREEKSQKRARMRELEQR